MGSSTSLSAACTTRSRTVGMPSRRRLPPGLGIIRSRTGTGRNARAQVGPQLDEEHLPRRARSRWHRPSGRPPPPSVRPGCSAPGAMRLQGRRVTDEVEEVGEPTLRVIGRPSVQLGLHPQYPHLRLRRRRPRRAGVHRRPPALPRPVCEVAALLRPVAGFPGLRLLRGLRPSPGPSADDAPARCPRAGRAAPGWFPRSPHDRSMGVVPSFSPAASATDTPQAFSVALEHGFAPCAPRRAPATTAPILLLPGPYPPGSSRWSSLEGVPPLVQTSCTVPSRLPDPGRLAVPARPVVVGAAPILPCVSRVRLPPASSTCCDRPTVGSCLPPGHVAPRGARSRRARGRERAHARASGCGRPRPRRRARHRCG